MLKKYVSFTLRGQRMFHNKVMMYDMQTYDKRGNVSTAVGSSKFAFFG
jgi:hypothetical protein